MGYFCQNWSGTKYPEVIYSQDEVKQPCLHFRGCEGVFQLYGSVTNHALGWRIISLQWRHNGRGSVSNHQPHDCLLNRLFRRSSRKTSIICVTGLCARNSPGTDEFPAQMASNAENVPIWWRHHVNDIWQKRKLKKIVKRMSLSMPSRRNFLSNQCLFWRKCIKIYIWEIIVQ